MSAVLMAVAALALPAKCSEACVARVQAREAQTRAMVRRARARVVTEHRKERVRPFRGWLLKVRLCESEHHGLYRANTGNGYFGAYQFDLRSWAGAGGRGMPHRASELEQDFRAVRWLEIAGRGAWPVCG